MRNRFILLLILILVFALTACSSRPKSDSNNEKDIANNANDVNNNLEGNTEKNTEENEEEIKDKEDENLFNIDDVEINIHTIFNKGIQNVRGDIKNKSNHDILLVSLKAYVNDTEKNLLEFKNYDILSKGKTSYLGAKFETKDSFIKYLKNHYLRIVYKTSDNKIREFTYDYSINDRDYKGKDKEFISLKSDFDFKNLILDKDSFKMNEKKTDIWIDKSLNSVFENKNKYDIYDINYRFLVRELGHELKIDNILKYNETRECNLSIEHDILSFSKEFEEKDFSLNIKEVLFRGNSDTEEYYKAYNFPKQNITLIERIEK